MDNPTSVSSAIRGRSSTIIPIADDLSNEIYNIPSRRRQTLLTQLGEALQTENIPVPFWAGLQVCDLIVLEKMVDKARAASEFVWVVAKYSCRHLPLLWLQKPAKTEDAPASTSTSTSSSVFTSVDGDGHPTKKRQSRESKPVYLASKRECNLCFLKRTHPKDIAHIYPNFLIHPRPEHAQRTVQFWDLLKIFWTPEKLTRWRSQIYNDPTDPTKAADTVKNLICMNPEIHRMWGDAQFALRPLGYNHNKTELTLEWHWLAKQTHEFHGEVAVSKVPIPTTNLDSTTHKRNYPVKLLIEMGPDTSRRIKTGDRIIMTTCNPENLPLPDHDLLDLQYHLQRLSSMAAAAEVDDSYDEDRHQPMAGANINPVDQWLESLSDQNHVPAKLERQPISPSSSRPLATDTDTSEKPDFSSTASTAPSPVKTQQHAMENLSVEEPSYLVEGQ